MYPTSQLIENGSLIVWSQEEVVEPLNSLVKGLFLGKSLMLLGDVSAHRKAANDH